MGIERRDWGRVGDAEVRNYTLTNASGSRLVLSEFGATVVSVEMPAPSGELADVVLGFDRLEDYVATRTYFGATVGRFGNRIRRGRFELDGQKYQVVCNEGLNSLHGGANGFDKRIWTSEAEPERNAVSFGLVSPDGDEGFRARCG